MAAIGLMELGLPTSMPDAAGKDIGRVRPGVKGDGLPRVDAVEAAMVVSGDCARSEAGDGEWKLPESVPDLNGWMALMDGRRVGKDTGDGGTASALPLALLPVRSS